MRKTVNLVGNSHI